MKVKISWWRITWRYVLIFLVLFALAFFSASSLFFTFGDSGELVPVEWGPAQTIFIAVFVGLFAAIYVLALFGFSYIIEDKFFIVKRMGKEITFDYSNIEFIDINESKRKKMVIFYSKAGKMRYLLGDRDGVLLETLIKKCPKIMTVEEFRRRHPEERY